MFIIFEVPTSKHNAPGQIAVFLCHNLTITSDDSSFAKVQLSSQNLKQKATTVHLESMYTWYFRYLQSISNQCTLDISVISENRKSIPNFFSGKKTFKKI